MSARINQARIGADLISCPAVGIVNWERGRQELQTCARMIWKKCPNRQTELQLGYLVVLEYLFASQRSQREKALDAEPVSQRVLVYQLGNVKVPVFGVLWM